MKDYTSRIAKTILIFSIAVFAAASAFSSQEPARSPIITRTPNIDIMKIAHRGAKIYAPENTIPSIEKAIELKYDYVEMDVQYTRDGVPVLFHDPFLSGKTDGFGAIPLFNLAKLKKLDAGSSFSPEFKHTRIPTLEEALQVMSGKINLYLDQKAPPRPIVYELLKRYGFNRDNMVVVGPFESFMLEFAKNFDNAPVMPNLRDARDVAKVLAKFPTAKAFNTRCQDLTPEMIGAAHERGVMIFSNVLGLKDGDEEACMRRTIELGADAMQFDRLDKLTVLIEKMRAE